MTTFAIPIDSSLIYKLYSRIPPSLRYPYQQQFSTFCDLKDEVKQWLSDHTVGNYFVFCNYQGAEALNFDSSKWELFMAASHPLIMIEFMNCDDAMLFKLAWL